MSIKPKLHKVYVYYYCTFLAYLSYVCLDWYGELIVNICYITELAGGKRRPSCSMCWISVEKLGSFTKRCYQKPYSLCINLTEFNIYTLFSGFLSALQKGGIAEVTLHSLIKRSSYGAASMACKKHNIQIHMNPSENSTVFFHLKGDQR